MKRILLFALAGSLVAVLGLAGTASAFEGTLMGALASRQARQYPWHGGYYHPAWGMPVAVVVPPVAESQTHWGWGVGNTRIKTIPHQFGRNYPGPGQYRRRTFRPTPPWPADTDQFGAYYIRGPW